jgi:hypothetical protein
MRVFGSKVSDCSGLDLIGTLGDVGKVDERGSIWITDRLKEIIKVFLTSAHTPILYSEALMQSYLFANNR